MPGPIRKLGRVRYSESPARDLDGDRFTTLRSAETDLDGGWTVAVDLFEDGDRLAVGGLRIFASEDVPAAGLPAELLRRVPLQALKEYAQACATAENRWGFGWPMTRLRRAPRRPGRRGRGDDFYLEWAVAYVRILEHGHATPYEEVARQMGSGDTPYSVEDARRVIERAREHDLLTRPGRGHSSATALTERARTLLLARESRTNIPRPVPPKP